MSEYRGPERPRTTTKNYEKDDSGSVPLPFDISVSREEYDRITTSGPEADFKAMIGERSVLAFDEFKKLVKDAGLVHFKAGTYHTPDKQLWLYAKKGFYSRTIEQAQADKITAEALTERGVVFPGTKWGIYQTENGNYHLFAYTRGLKHSSSDAAAFDVSILMEDLSVRVGIKDPDTGEFLKDARYISNFNYREANHSQNWGFSPELGQYFPVDVEVIEFETADNREARRSEELAVLSRLAGQDQNI